MSRDFVSAEPMRVLIVQIDNLAHTYLRQDFGTVVAREQRDVDRGTLKVLERAAVVEHGVGLGMNYVVMLVLQRVIARAPREKVVVERRGRTVVAHRKNAVVGAGDARAHLRIGIL